MSNPLTDIIPVKRRKLAYAILAGFGLLLTGTFAGFAAIGVAIPKALIFVSAFYGAVAGPSFAVANANART